MSCIAPIVLKMNIGLALHGNTSRISGCRLLMCQNLNALIHICISGLIEKAFHTVFCGATYSGSRVIIEGPLECDLILGPSQNLDHRLRKAFRSVGGKALILLVLGYHVCVYIYIYICSCGSSTLSCSIVSEHRLLSYFQGFWAFFCFWGSGNLNPKPWVQVSTLPSLRRRGPCRLLPC